MILSNTIVIAIPLYRIIDLFQATSLLLAAVSVFQLGASAAQGSLDNGAVFTFSFTMATMVRISPHTSVHQWNTFIGS